MPIRTRTLVFLAAAQLLACGTGAKAPPIHVVPQAGADASGSLSVASGGPEMNTALRAAIDAALADASRRTGKPVSALRVVEAVSLTWPDGSLGCAEPGVMYTMAPVPGFLIRIRAGAEVLSYHGRNGAPPLYCPPGRGGATAPGGTR